MSIPRPPSPMAVEGAMDKRIRLAFADLLRAFDGDSPAVVDHCRLELRRALAAFREYCEWCRDYAAQETKTQQEAK